MLEYGTFNIDSAGRTNVKRTATAALAFSALPYFSFVAGDVQTTRILHDVNIASEVLQPGRPYLISSAITTAAAGGAVIMPTEYTKENRNVRLQAGAEFLVAVEANPTTGYRWGASFDSGMLQLIARDFSPYGAGVGSGGIERLRFKALRGGDTELRLLYKRAWEKTAIKDMVFHVYVNE